MHSDLQHLIHLQELDLSAERDRRRVTDIPLAQAALDERISMRSAAVDAVRQRVAAMQTARREIERELSTVQARLSKFKNQLMEVKTNKEYQAMQKEMGVAEEEISTLETRLLERMVEADGLAIELKSADAALKAEQSAVASERKQLDEERVAVDRDLERVLQERDAVSSRLSREALALFDRIALRKGVALAEARDGLCTVCHVRLRPQVFNDVRRNDSLIQCESCNRILYFVPTPASGAVSATEAPG